MNKRGLHVYSRDKDIHRPLYVISALVHYQYSVQPLSSRWQNAQFFPIPSTNNNVQGDSNMLAYSIMSLLPVFLTLKTYLQAKSTLKASDYHRKWKYRKPRTVKMENSSNRRWKSHKRHLK